MNKKVIVGILSIVVLVVIVFSISASSKSVSVRSVQIGGEYQATTSSASTMNVAPGTVTLKTGSGTLGSVVITSAAAGIINIFDATTSDTTQRGNTATGTLRLITSFPASAAAGTYTYDAAFFTGLLYSTVGVQGTTTVTFR